MEKCVINIKKYQKIDGRTLKSQQENQKESS